jgi:hypothetical protein
MSADGDDGEPKTQSRVTPGDGKWIMPSVSYVDPTRRFCELCGRPIARRYWRARTERGEGIFCDPAHAALYATYPRSTDQRDD